MFKLDQDQARKSDQSFGGKIEQKGKYKGEITRFVWIKSKNTGAKGVELRFKSDAGETAMFQIYTHSAAGDEYFGYKQLMSLLAVLNIRTEIKPKPAQYMVWDKVAKAEVEKELLGFPMVEGKRLGILVELEDSEYQGNVTTKPIVSMFFQADTELSASEVLDGTTVPALVAARVPKLRHKTLQPKRGQEAQSQGSRKLSDSESHANQSVPFDEDDIPF